MFLRVIYIDILLVINLTVDYLVIFGTARLAGIRFSRIKGLAGALLGSVYSVIILFDLPKAIFIFSKIAVSVLIVLISFGKRKISELLKILLVFYICGFIFSGFMMLVNNIVHADSFFVKSGIVYFEFSAVGIVISGTLAFLLTEILRRVFRRGEPEGSFIAKIYYGEKVAVLKGFTDTGNNLSEPISGTPVAVTTADSVKRILPPKMFEAIEKMDLSTEFGLRIVPCKSVSSSVLILAFRPDKTLIINEKGEFETEDIMIAVSENVPENTLIVGRNIILKEKNKIFSEV